MKHNKLLLRASGIYLLIGLLLAWSLIGVYTDVPIARFIFPGDPQRVLQGHIDFLLMTALILGVSAAKVSLAWHVQWAMVIGAFTNSSIFLAFAMMPAIDPRSEAFLPEATGSLISHYSIRLSFIITTYGFGGAAIGLIRSTFLKKKQES
ncbi:hypothetical protein [Mangrovimonas sp. DI 80]|uniref:hypothetical protein n=1 Tax=Mangrovimonas sp. DI 80 TaxID=1779330 RepID=UPI000976A2EB|nr:hypothetical protein [Mangrovimonas sp. DI 80]OMP32856.1 hypothetical protein BKM32_00675 [Mangrovimonas sp. DI 80]